MAAIQDTQGLLSEGTLVHQKASICVCVIESSGDPIAILSISGTLLKNTAETVILSYFIRFYLFLTSHCIHEETGTLLGSRGRIKITHLFSCLSAWHTSNSGENFQDLAVIQTDCVYASPLGSVGTFFLIVPCAGQSFHRDVHAQL